jgi:hypothetical protein
MQINIKSIFFTLTGICLLTYFTFSEVQAQSLFDSTEPLKLGLEADLATIVNDISEEPEYISGRLIEYHSGNKINLFDVKVRPRGNTRRVTGLCEFPPLKINFKKSQIQNTTFDGNDKIKLVLRCRESEQFTNYLYEEYLIYKAYNLITDESFRVRLITITVKDTGYNLPDMTLEGFIIEDDETFAKRTATKQYDGVVHSQDSCEAANIDRMAMFQYMIGNTDWYVNTRHNINIFQRKDSGTLIAVPFDFDFAGVINTLYATTSKEIPINRVTDRFYKGSCRNPEVQEETIRLFNEKKEQIYELYENFEHLSEYVIKKDLRFYSKFYKIINDTEQIQEELSTCIKPAFTARGK